MARYRGPDDFGYVTVNTEMSVRQWNDEWLRDYVSQRNILGAIGFRRLSIIDLSSKGHQPMHDETRRFWIVHNGEVYNYLEIRDELLAMGYSFSSETDTEVVLKAYMEWGKECLERFNGMWAFCVLDTVARNMFCARDRLGIKPFYYYFDRSDFVFGSEIKQLLQLIPRGSVTNPCVLFDYLALGHYGNENQNTFFRDVLRLLPGEFLVVDISDAGNFVARKEFWWDLPDDGMSEVLSETDVYDNIRSLLEDSVRLRLRSDVTLGTCLSGGLDSSGIVLLVDRLRKISGAGDRHKVFVIGSIDSELDETRYARMVVNATNVELFIKYPNSVDIEDDLERFIWHNDEPLLGASIFGGWQVYKLAKESGASVVLDGQGSDELLGGYHFGPHIDLLEELILTGRVVDFQRQLRRNASLHKVDIISLIIKLVAQISRHMARSVLPSSYRPGVFRSTHGWLNKDFVKANIRYSYVNRGDSPFANRRFSSSLKKQTYQLTRITNLPGILRQVDRNSMAFSVEARVPFLDHRLVEFLYKLPMHYILRNGYTKYAYRQALRGVIPEPVRLRTDKRGFAMPDRILLEGALPFVRSIVEKIPLDSPIYDVINIRKRIEKSIIGDESYEPIVWRILNAIIWQCQFTVRC